MLISLIVPAFNEEKYLSKLLDSVLTQTYLPDEIIICDNGSTDNTVKVVSPYKNVLPIKIVTEPQKGIAKALQTAWENSTGDLIIRTDADTILPEYWVKNIVQHFLDDPKLAAGGGNVFSIEKTAFYKIMDSIICPAADLYFIPLRGFQFIWGANSAFRRSTLEKIHGYQCLGIHDPEDQMMCRKLKNFHLKFYRFSDCNVYTSMRRFNSNPKEVWYALLSIIAHPNFYHEKSV